MLHEAIVGALRARGTSFSRWCRENDVSQPTARSASYGLMGGPKGQKILSDMIEAAGLETVEFLYRRSLEAESRRIA
jgi:lambda repressor-like predicted transcriptional regulator